MRDLWSAIRTIAWLLACVLGCCAGCLAPETARRLPVIHVAAASDLTPVFTELGAKLEADGELKAVFSFGSSGLLAKQIEQGAPFDLFAAANEVFIDRLRDQGLIIEESRQVFAQGRLIIWQRQDTKVPAASLKDLARPALRRVAIANPEHAPYGLAARQALEHEGVWEAVRERIVFGENVVQAWQFAQTGNVEAAIVARSLASRDEGRSVEVDPGSHAPINQTLAILRRSSSVAGCRQFLHLLNSPAGQSILERYGFSIPARR